MMPESSPADAVMSLKTEPGIYSSVMFLFFHWASRIIPCNWVYSLATSLPSSPMVFSRLILPSATISATAFSPRRPSSQSISLASISSFSKMSVILVSVILYGSLGSNCSMDAMAKIAPVLTFMTIALPRPCTVKVFIASVRYSSTMDCTFSSMVRNRLLPSIASCTSACPAARALP